MSESCTRIVSWLALRSRSGLRPLLLRLAFSFICRRRECMLFCFFRARTGEILKESVPRLRCAGIGTVGGEEGV